MQHKHVLYHSAAREKLLAGSTALADAVRVTLGPKSKSVLIGKKWGSPIICNDGVTIAKEMSLEDPDEDLGAQMIREAAVKTGDAVGDGTSTSTLLAHAIFTEGVRNVAAGASAIDLKRGLDRGLVAAVASIKSSARPIATRKEREQVAAVSAHNDDELGRLVADALERVGTEGAVTVEEAKGTETTLDVVQGMQLDRGYLSPYFVSDTARMEAVLDRPYVLICDRRIVVMQDLVPLLEHTAKEGRALLIVAEDVEGDALATLVVNKLRGILPCAAIKAPGFGDNRKAMLEDIAVLTGARVISQETGDTLKDIDPEVLGSADRVVITHDETTIVGGAGEKAALDGRRALLRTQIDAAKSDYDRDKLKERLGRLSGGVAVIRVGAASEAEMKRRKEAFDDAINTARAAIAEGVVPGAGLVLLRATLAIEALESTCDGDERTGLRILRHALEAPTRQIAENTGVDAGVVVDRMLQGAGNWGFDAARSVYVDLVEAGILDAAKVVRCALENAVSVAGTLLLTEATMTEVEEKKNGAGPIEAE
jgi:chaperonin GroEL